MNATLVGVNRIDRKKLSQDFLSRPLMGLTVDSMRQQEQWHITLHFYRDLPASSLPTTCSNIFHLQIFRNTTLRHSRLRRFVVSSCEFRRGGSPRGELPPQQFEMRELPPGGPSGRGLPGSRGGGHGMGGGTSRRGELRGGKCLRIRPARRGCLSVSGEGRSRSRRGIGAAPLSRMGGGMFQWEGGTAGSRSPRAGRRRSPR